jgi:hypothetical protein
MAENKRDYAVRRGNPPRAHPFLRRNYPTEGVIAKRRRRRGKKGQSGNPRAPRAKNHRAGEGDDRSADNWHSQGLAGDLNQVTSTVI